MQIYQFSLPTRVAAWLGLLAWALAGAAQADSGRWYTPDLVQEGGQVFATNCAECHGVNGEAKPDWRTVDAEGRYPPPPLDGSAHAWHHPLEMLRSTVRKGGAPVGGVMPPFEGKLSPREMDAAIAFFQNKWQDGIYAAWLERNGEAAHFLKVSAPTETPSPVTASLKRTLPNVEIGAPEATPLPGIQQVKLGNRYAYLTDDGHYALVGDLLDLERGINLTDIRRNQDTSALLAAFPEKDMVVYPAEGTERARITVFTDTSCPYCRKLHREVPQLRQAGVTVRYIAFPRAGIQGDVYRTMRSVWCAPDRRKAMDAAKGVIEGKQGDATCAEGKTVDAGFQLAKQLGLRGTPAIVLPDGAIQPGYLPAPKLLTRLGLAKDTTRLIQIPGKP